MSERVTIRVRKTVCEPVLCKERKGKEWEVSKKLPMQTIEN